MSKSPLTTMVKPGPIHQVTPEYALADKGLERTGDGKNTVRWATTNPRHPRNWSPLKKVYDITIIILLEFYTLVAFLLCQLPVLSLC